MDRAGLYLDISSAEYFATATASRLARLFSAHSDPYPCWPLPGGRDKDGYCRVKHAGKTYSAHRVAYELFHGPIPAGLSVLHACDNPACCNPHHLFVGTQRDNYQDAKHKDRHSRGERNGWAKLTDDDVRAIRASSETQWTLARRYGVWQGTIWQIIHHKHWTHVR
jgi:hypothetical protein